LSVVIATTSRLSSARIRSITALGALVVLADVLQDRADLVQVGRLVLHEQGRRLGVAQDRAERLVDLVRQRRRDLPHHRDPADVGDVLAQAQHLLLGLFRRGDVDARAATAQGVALGVVVDAPEGGDPAQAAVGQDDAKLVLVLAVPSRRLAQAVAKGRAIVDMNPLHQLLVAQTLVGGKAEQLAHLLARQHAVADDVARPDAEIRRVGGQFSLSLALAQFADELLGAQQVGAERVRHDGDDAEGEETDGARGVAASPVDDDQPGRGSQA
jgi:hypothetical protein